MKLSARILDFRCERPSEFLMDDFAKDAAKLENAMSDMLKAMIDARRALAYASKNDGALLLAHNQLDAAILSANRSVE